MVLIITLAKEIVRCPFFECWHLLSVLNHVNGDCVCIVQISEELQWANSATLRATVAGV